MASTISRWHEQIAIQTIIVCALEWWHAWKLYSQLLAWVLPLHPRTRINGAKKACEAKKDTHIRCALQYDIFLGWRSCHRFLMDQYQLLPLYIQPHWQEEPIRWGRRVLCWYPRERAEGRKGGAAGDQKEQGKTWGPQLLTQSNVIRWSHPLHMQMITELQTSNSFIKFVFIYPSIGVPLKPVSTHQCFWTGFPEAHLGSRCFQRTWSPERSLGCWQHCTHWGIWEPTPGGRFKKFLQSNMRFVWYMYSYGSWMIIWTHPNP